MAGLEASPNTGGSEPGGWVVRKLFVFPLCKSQAAHPRFQIPGHMSRSRKNRIPKEDSAMAFFSRFFFPRSGEPRL